MQATTYEDGQYLTFLLGSEVFGIGILHIKEIKEFSNITPIPMMPNFVQGVMNLRGNVVPIIDLHVRFGRSKTTITKKTCIIIVEVQHEGELLDIGILVDSVNEVVDIPGKSVEPAPVFGAKIRIDFIHGIGKIENNFIILLNINKALSVEELSSIEESIAGKVQN